MTRRAKQTMPRLRRGRAVTAEDTELSAEAQRQREEEEERARQIAESEEAELALEAMLDITYSAAGPTAMPAAADEAPMRPEGGSSSQTAFASGISALDASLHAAEQLWHEGRLEEALIAMTALLEDGALLSDYRGDEGLVLTRIALLHEEMGDLAQALEFHFRRVDKALQEHEAAPWYSDGQKAQIRCYDNIARLYLKLGKKALYKTYLDKAEQVKKEMLRVKISDTLEEEEDKEKFDGTTAGLEQKNDDQNREKRKEAEMERLREQEKNDAAEEARMVRLNEANAGLTEIIRALNVPCKQRSNVDVHRILEALNSIEYLRKRTNDHQRRELCRLARYETHIEAFAMYEPGDPADRAWIILGCTPFLEDYKGSVDIMAWDQETTSEVIGRVVHAGGLFGEDALDGANARTTRCLVSDDGHDDVITTNHFLTLMRDDFEEVINTYYHETFEVYPATRHLDCKHSYLGDAGVADLSWFLINSGNKVLVSLDLQMNNIGPTGAERVAELMAKNQAITSLDMSHNHVADFGATTLCSALAANTTLKSLSLRCNGISNLSGNALQNLLRSNTVLTSIDLKENDLCYSEAVSQLSNFAQQQNFSIHGEGYNGWSLLQLGQSREQRAHDAKSAAATKRQDPALGPQHREMSTPKESSSHSSEDILENGWKDRQRRYPLKEEAYANTEIEAIMRRLRLALSASRNYQFLTNTEGQGALRRECLKTDVRRRRILTQRDFMSILKRFDVDLSVDDAADIASCFGYCAYGSEARSTTVITPGTNTRKESAGSASKKAGLSGPSRGTNSSQGRPKSNKTREREIAESQARARISSALSSISRQSNMSEADAARPNDLLIVWPWIVHTLEGGCQTLIEEFFAFENLDREKHELEFLYQERLQAGSSEEQLLGIREQLDRLNTTAKSISGF